jgi:hypothetical protein
VKAHELAIARQFRVALEHAAKTGEWTLVYPCLAPDVEWITPQRTLTGIDAVKHDLTWGSPPEKLDVEFEIGDWSTSTPAMPRSTCVRPTA